MVSKLGYGLEYQTTAVLAYHSLRVQKRLDCCPDRLKRSKKKLHSRLGVIACLGTPELRKQRNYIIECLCLIESD